jgi:hypothetical protein
MDILERQTELDELARLLREAGASAGKIAFVSGEAGAGKSTLVEQFACQLAGKPRVYWGHCDALQTSRVLGPINEVAAEMSLWATATSDSGQSREQLFSRLFERLSPPHPVSVVVLEDLHWADEATLDFVRFIGRRIQRTRCLLIATHRDDELTSTHLLRGVLGELTGQHTARLAVPALSFNAVEQLAQGTHRNARKVYQVTGGNPFFVRELLSTPMDAVPGTVRDAVLARLMQCSPAAREVAELVSLVPGKTEAWITRTILGDIGAAADEAVMRGLLRYHKAPSRAPGRRRFIRAFWAGSLSTTRTFRSSCTTRRSHRIPRRCSSTRRAPRSKRHARAPAARPWRIWRQRFGMSIRWIRRSAPDCLNCMRQNATRPIRLPRR